MDKKKRGLLTQEEVQENAKNRFNSIMRDKHPNIKYSEYIKASQKVNCECLVCGHKWDSTPNNLTTPNRYRGCPKCGGQIPKYSDEYLRRSILEKYPDIILPNGKLSEKIGIDFKFKNDDENVSYHATPKVILNSKTKSFRLNWNLKLYKERLYKANPNIECKGEWINKQTKIEHFCKKHNVSFLIDPTHALRGQGCLQCKLDKIGEAKRHSHADYLLLLNEVNPTVIPLEEYKSGSKPLLHKCLKCGHIWSPFPQNLYRLKEGCPKCSSSRGEKRIAEILEENDIQYTPQYRIVECRNKKPLPFDFAVFKNDKLLFLCEFQGRQHYQISQFGGMSQEKAKIVFEEMQSRDKIKFDFCKNNNIDLLIIKYTDYDNLENVLFNYFNKYNLISGGKEENNG